MADSVLTLALAGDALDRLADELADRIAVLVAARMGAKDARGWLDTKAAAQYAGCSPNAMHKAMSAREIRFTQEAPGGKAWFKTEWIDAWRGV